VRTYIAVHLKWPQLQGGSHICVASRSVCDWDQNGIKQSTFILGADEGIKSNYE